MEFDVIAKLMLIDSLYIWFLAFEEIKYYCYLEKDGEGKKYNIIPFIIASVFSFYGVNTLSYIGVFVAGLVMLKTLIILVIKKEWLRLIYFIIRNEIYVLILYGLYTTDIPIKKLLFFMNW
ncbi:hypothetical protein JJB67_09625 [Clostridium perfringens]|uniref:hypothetical protein n=1 Tax=Clostridium perfringens TaxID=1502 RepID=UPI000D716F45|nr:hypothetical protein [Clostridium perfringens]MBO3322837.1 hypothetical protein [Clostridium perfringens]MBO3331754.1 hypothetical protein [Clostridium perfringens]PWW99032.1 hypothetical protein CYK73_13970 [Clostridium perfringens]PWW99768.1 hypothetical protein CYK75_10120 [Clostridium perfringens]